MEQKIKELEERILKLEMAQNLDAKELFLEGLLHDKGDYGSNLQRTVNVSSTPFQFTIPENPINSLQINYKGTNYRILLYSLS